MNKLRLPIWAKGFIIGELVWGLSLLFAYISDEFDSWFPQWFRQLDLPDTLGSICMLIAAPLPIGWFLIYGDTAAPPRWFESWVSIIGFGFLFYGLLGILIALSISKIFRWRKIQKASQQ